MLNIEVNFAPFERDRLPELFQGGVSPEGSATMLQLATISTGRGLIAIWLNKIHGINPLPNIIIGNAEVINDLCAWCQAFMPGIGPLSSLIRLLSHKELRDIISHYDPDTRYGLEFAGQHVSLIYSEVIARSSAGNAVEQVSLKSCTNTLSFALFRMETLGLQRDVDRLSTRWSAARNLDARADQRRITDAVLSIYQQIGSKSLLQESESSDINSLIDSLSIPLRRRSGIMRRYSSEISDQPLYEGLTNVPKEDILKLIDIVLEEVYKSKSVSLRGYISVAKLINMVTKNFNNQLSILGPSAAGAPELILSLGYIRGFSTAAEILSSYNGIGWRLLTALSKNYNIFDRPECDISYQEIVSYGSLANSLTLGDNGKYTVEIGLGINTEIQNERLSKKTIRDDLFLEEDAAYSRNLASIDEIERRLFDTLDFVRRIRKDGTTKRRS